MRLGRRERELSPPALVRLAEHHWPGNLRELEQVLEKLVVFSAERMISREQVSDVLGESGDSVKTLRTRRQEDDRRLLVDALRETGGNLTQAAERLGKSRGAIRHQAKKFGLI